MSGWIARDRHCGRTFPAEVDSAFRLVDVTACPHCGHSPIYVDLIQEIEPEIKASTAAKQLAKVYGIDLATLTPTGKDGSIIRADVEKKIAELEAQEEPESDEHQVEGAESDEGEAGGEE